MVGHLSFPGEMAWHLSFVVGSTEFACEVVKDIPQFL